MNKAEWFVNYCNMSEDDRWLYKEFEMKDEDKIHINIYKRLYDAVLLMASDYEKQIALLPKGINIADEIALVFDDEVIAVSNILFQKGMLSKEEYDLIISIGNKLNEMSKLHDFTLWTITALKYSENWKYCRNKAQILLSSLCNFD